MRVLQIATWPLVLVSSSSCQGVEARYQFSAAETKFAYSNNARLRQTLNISRWFGRDSRQTDIYYSSYMSDAELDTIRRWGFTAIRLPVREPFMFVSSSKDKELPSNSLKQLDSAIRRINKAGLSVIVDFHSKERKLQETSSTYLDKVSTFWDLLAKHLSLTTDPRLVYLEILNEPRFLYSPDSWNAIQLRLFKVIRNSAHNHTIIATSTRYSDPQTFSSLAMLPDSNVIYTLHTYDPNAFTHQGADYLSQEIKGVSGLPWPATKDCSIALQRANGNAAAINYINTYCSSGWNAAKFALYLAPAIDWAKERHVPLFVGEFGVRATAAPSADRLAWLSMASSLFSQKGLSWGLWSYDDCYGLSLKVQGACPAGVRGKVDWVAAWKRACATIAALNLRQGACQATQSIPDNSETGSKANLDSDD